MYCPADSEFLSGQAFAGMPFGFNRDFDAFRSATPELRPQKPRKMTAWEMLWASHAITREGGFVYGRS
jgi:hypothetical protein